MRRLIKQWLGITKLETDVDILSFTTAKYHAELTALTKNEFHPDRVQASSELGRQVIERLKAEDQARRHTLGEF